jgi:hypothetical protein
MNHVVQSGCLDARFRYSDFASERLDRIPVVDDKSIGLFYTTDIVQMSLIITRLRRMVGSITVVSC